MTTATSSDLVISPGYYHEESALIEVLPLFDGGLNQLTHANSILTGVVDEDKNSVLTNVEIGESFFYEIEQYNDKQGSLRQLLLSESGIGELVRIGDRIFLERNHVFQQSLEDDFYSPITSTSFLTFDNTYLIITTSIPSNYQQLCFQPHSVICTVGAFAPTPVELRNNTVLGRTSGRIEALGRVELGHILGYHDPTQVVQQYTDSLILATSLLELVGADSKIVSHQLHLRARNRHPTTKTKGCLIFNDDKKVFEGFDGTKWRPLAWAE